MTVDSHWLLIAMKITDIKIRKNTQLIYSAIYSTYIAHMHNVMHIIHACKVDMTRCKVFKTMNDGYMNPCTALQ